MKLQAPRVHAPSLADLTDADPDEALNPAGTDGCRIEGAVLDGIKRTGVTYRETELVRATATGAKLTDCRFLDVRFEAFDAPDVVASHTTLRDVEILGSRIGRLALDDSTISGVRLERCKIGLLGLQGAEVHDLVVESCSIEELDLSEAVAARVAFRDTRIDHLRVKDARLSHVDLREARLDTVEPAAGLRGATVTFEQLLDLAPELAAALGIRVD